MEIKLTKEQLALIEDRLKENHKEENELRIKDRKNEPVNGWDFIALANERGTLEDVLKKGYTEL